MDDANALSDLSAKNAIMLTTHAVGIDLGTTYSCLAYLNEHGEPVTLPNQEGETSTPSVVLFDGNEVVVGTEALRNAIVHPERVVQHAKRYMGDPQKHWSIDNRKYSPVDVSSYVLRKLLSAAQEQIGPIERAVVTVPAQFSDAQRHATILAGHKAGLEQVDVINEPVAAALCHVLGTEGLWFSELAEEQTILVYDLGGGTFDLSLVKYRQNEVSVIASVGDLQLGGLDWNNALQEAIAQQFKRDFGVDPQSDPSSRQALALEVEQTKRSLSVRPKSSLTVQHAGHRKSYHVELGQFERLTKPLVDRTAKIVKKLLKDRKMGWAHVDVVLTTGGASRMPMVREMLKSLSGRTLNTTLSPDQSIAHGATYYAGMLLTNSKFARSILNEHATARLSRVRQQSVNARALGILVRDVKTNQRVPHYLVEANTPLPAKQTKRFGTVMPNQRRVKLKIIESGASPGFPPVQIGECVVNNLAPNLPEGSEIAVTISYDESARVHVDALDLTSGRRASAEIIRQQNVVPQLAADHLEEEYSGNQDVHLLEEEPANPPGGPAAPPVTPKRPAVQPAPQHQPKRPLRPAPPRGDALEEADEPIPLDEHGRPLNAGGLSPDYSVSRSRPQRGEQGQPKRNAARQQQSRRKPVRRRATQPPPPPPSKPEPGEDEFWNLTE